MTESDHFYLSTSCYHGLHAYCKSELGDNGDEMWHKKPGQCKFCGAPCICECHREGR